MHIYKSHLFTLASHYNEVSRVFFFSEFNIIIPLIMYTNLDDKLAYKYKCLNISIHVLLEKLIAHF